MIDGPLTDRLFCITVRRGAALLALAVLYPLRRYAAMDVGGFHYGKPPARRL